MKLATAPLRAEHADLMARITVVDALAPALEAAPSPAERLKLMAEIVRFFEGYLLPHAAVEDHVLYAVADQKSGGRFTASLRHEHRIIARWVGDLSVLLRKSAPDAADARMFARRTDALLGLVRGHIECEEGVVLAFLDGAMTADEFQREVADKMT